VASRGEELAGAAAAFEALAGGLALLGRRLAPALGRDALAVGRVQHHRAGRHRRRALQRVGGLELDGVAHAGALGVARGEVGHAKAHVAGKHLDSRRMHAVASGLLQITPCVHVGAEGQHALEGKAPLAAGCDAAGHLRRLDGDGAGAAAGVEQRAAPSSPG
jgi:hypothetical protein